MDKMIDSRFERLEKALAGLIDSVTKYHPSIALARELELADEELTKGLEQVQTHQNNYLRIQKLRETSAALDTQIRETLSSLATTRKDIVTTHTTTYPDGPNYTIAYDELLSYARRISKTTLPPSSTINSLPPQPASGEQTPATDSQPQSALTPNAPTPSQTQSPAVVNGASQASSAQPTQQTTTLTTLPEHFNQFLNPLSGQVFFPWPTEDKIRGGALASNQMLLEQGIDPKGYDPAAEEQRKMKEEEERKEREEREKKEREEAERRRNEERERLRKEREAQRAKEQEEWQRGSVAGPPSAISPTTSGGQFQFASMDDDDD
ncbi:hypothetical protein NLU13_0911 [Sarocladium strictum]|uniref:Mediator of RNA polymerase II transcription subunit 4 n=1 Tax=Sarocladium strictum TaxID=5046 RepID=A0AA39LB91_SARSR|nr:hypothetical protein NLU13_0911 [Sarocladium strictum]